MSEATKEAIEDAIRAHVADEGGEALVITDWYVITAAIGVDDEETHYFHVQSGGPWHTITGLVQLAWRRMSSWIDIEDR